MRIAFLGIGMMGLPMARRLCEAGHAVHAWNRSRDRAEPLAAAGATVHDAARAAVDGAELVISILADGAVTGSVLFDASWGAAAAMRPGT
ncbi:MAG: NAD(P)-binding domain-containing protein, partial [Burkholderiales bacterium]